MSVGDFDMSPEGIQRLGHSVKIHSSEFVQESLYIIQTEIKATFLAD